MTFSLRNKLIFSFFLLVLLSTGIFAFLANRYIDQQFNAYLINRQKQYANELRKMLTDVYSNEGQIDKRIAHFMFRGGMRDGYRILVHDQDRKLIWDPKHDFPQRETTHGKRRHHALYKPLPGIGVTYLAHTYPIFHQNQEVAYLEIGYLNRGMMSEQDRQFLDALNRSLLFSGLLCLLFALIFSLWLSRNLVIPIKQLVQKAERIRLGEREPLAWKTTSTKELDLLSETLNNLISSLEKQEMLRKQLTSDLSHELRTPLATLQSHLEALIDGIWEVTPDRLESCHYEVLRLSRMIQELRQLNHLEEHNFVIEMVNLRLEPVLKNIVTNFYSQYEQKSLQLYLDCSDQLEVYLDQDKFMQIMVNLLSNAWKYTSPGGSVWVTATEEKEKTVITVADTGIGIEERDLPHIFERLYRGDKSRSRDTGGSGIGLAITKVLVEIQNGTIVVESVQGKGSKFILSFFPKR